VQGDLHGPAQRVEQEGRVDEQGGGEQQVRREAEGTQPPTTRPGRDVLPRAGRHHADVQTTGTWGGAPAPPVTRRRRTRHSPPRVPTAARRRRSGRRGRPAATARGSRPSSGSPSRGRAP